MILLPLTTPLLRSGDDLATILCRTGAIHNGDILVLSSKALATVEGAQIDLSGIEISEEAKKYAECCNQDPRFTQAILEETTRMNGRVVGTCPYALFTALRPEGMEAGVILCPNAGLDQSNVEQGFAIGWPRDAVGSIERLREKIVVALEKGIEENALTPTLSLPLRQGFEGQARGEGDIIPTNYQLFTHRSFGAGGPTTNFAVILSDSCCKPARLGVTAFALTCAGIDPLKSEVGSSDLFGKPLRMTHEALADQLATAGNILMGNAGQCTPAAIIRDHNIPFSNYSGWVNGIEPKDDLFADLLSFA
jgi:coenzyme F420-0:L-glutamate ligase / coenzyme F420-1:gamma-L-glutamate ligase